MNFFLFLETEQYCETSQNKIGKKKKKIGISTIFRKGCQNFILKNSKEWRV